MGVSRNDVGKRQEEIEEEIIQSRQELPNMEDEELFPTLSGKKQFSGTDGNRGQNNSLANKLGQSSGRTVSHTNYRGLAKQNLTR